MYSGKGLIFELDVTVILYNTWGPPRLRRAGYTIPAVISYTNLYSAKNVAAKCRDYCVQKTCFIQT